MPSISRIILLLVTLTLLTTQLPAAARARELLPQAREPYRKGILAAQQQDYKVALRYLLDAEQADPEAPELYFYLGLASSKLPGYELRALAWFQLYLMKVPDAPKAAAIREQIGALEVTFESRLGKILDGLTPLLVADKSPQSINDAFYLAYSRSYLGDFEGGLSLVRAATGKESWEEAANQYPAVRNRLDNIFTPLLMYPCADQDKFMRDTGSSGLKFSTGEFNEAQLPDYMRGLQSAKDPKSALATALSDLGRLSVVYRVINGTFDPGRQPDSYWGKHYAAAYHLRGMLRSMCPEYIASSIEDFTRGIEIDPNSATGYYIRGRTYAELKNYPKAIEDSSKAIEIDPKHADAYGVRGGAYIAQGDYRKAIDDLGKEMEFDPKITAYPYVQRGIAYLDLREYPKALEDFNKAVELDSKSTEAYLNRGRAYAGQAEYCRALQDYDQALELDPKNGEAVTGREQAQAEAMRVSAPILADDAADPGTPPAPGNVIADEVFRHLARTDQYVDLLALYNEKKGLACWIAGAEGAAVAKRFAMLRADAASPTVIKTEGGRMLQYTIGGQKVADQGIAVYELEKSSDYRGQIAEAIAQNILSNPAEPKLQAALEPFGALRKKNREKELDAIIPPAPGTPPKQLNEMAREVLRHLQALPDYQDLQALYEEKSTQREWSAGSEGKAVLRRLNLVRADLAEIEIVDSDRRRVLKYCVGGSKVLDQGIAVSALEDSPEYRSNIAEALARNIIATPAEALVQAALERFRASRQ